MSKELKDYGWAPGGYMNICSICGDHHYDCDKRASSCKPCAERNLRGYLTKRIEELENQIASLHNPDDEAWQKMVVAGTERLAWLDFDNPDPIPVFKAMLETLEKGQEND